MTINEYLIKLQEINYFISDEDKYYNFDKWGKEFNTLFILGLSGSGKTTLSINLSKKYNCKVYELDNILEEIYEKVKYELTNEQWENKKFRWKIIIDKIENFFKFLKNKKEKNIVEGVYILYVPEKSEYYKDKPLIIMNTSVLLSTIRAIKRNLPTDSYRRSKYEIIRDVIINQNEFINRIKIFEKMMNS